MKINKKHLIIIFLSFVSPLLIIHILFKLKIGIYWLEAEWSAGDILNYIAAFMATFSTVILGILTYKLSDKANIINDKLLKLEYSRSQPRIDVLNEPYKIIDKDIDNYIKKKNFSRNDTIYSSIRISNNKYENHELAMQSFEVSILVIEFKIKNTGSSDISQIFIDNNLKNSYIASKTPPSNYLFMFDSSNTSLKIDETKTFSILFKQEIIDEAEIMTFDINKNEDKKLRPHLEFNMTLVTNSGLKYEEKMILYTNFRKNKNNKNIRTFSPIIDIFKSEQ